MKNPFAFVKTIQNYMDDGKFFRNPVKWLYVIFAALNMLVPLFILYQFINRHIFSYLGAWQIVVVLIGWLVMSAGFVGLGIFWWTRKNQIDTANVEISEFPVTPVFAHLFRTMGEWMGLLIGVVAFATSLLMYILSGFKAGGAFGALPYAQGNGILSILLMPVAGFLIIMFTRFISEQIKVLVTIARNTKK